MAIEPKIENWDCDAVDNVKDDGGDLHNIAPGVVETTCRPASAGAWVDGVLEGADDSHIVAVNTGDGQYNGNFSPAVIHDSFRILWLKVNALFCKTEVVNVSPRSSAHAEDYRYENETGPTRPTLWVAVTSGVETARTFSLAGTDGDGASFVDVVVVQNTSAKNIVDLSTGTGSIKLINRVNFTDKGELVERQVQIEGSENDANDDRYVILNVPVVNNQINFTTYLVGIESPAPNAGYPSAMAIGVTIYIERAYL